MVRNAIFMLMLAVVSNSAMAAWSKVTVNEEATIYADLSTISKSGNMIKMWDVSDFKKKTTANNYLSLKSQREYDCKDKKNRLLTYSTFSGNMGNGSVVNSSSFARPWMPVYTGGIVSILWITACGKH
jgi:hypothetical protein